MAKAKSTKDTLKSTGRKTIKTEDTREKLLKVGREVFLKEGSKSLSVRGVATKAGVNLGSFVYNFKTKEAFIEEIIYSHYDEFVAILNNAMAGLGTNQDPLATLKRVIEVFGEASANYQPLTYRLLMDILQGEETIIKVASKKPPTHVLFVVEVIKKCQAQGQIRKDMDPRLVFILLASTTMFPTVIGHQIFKGFAKSKGGKEMFSLLTNSQARMDRLEIILKGLKP